MSLNSADPTRRQGQEPGATDETAGAGGRLSAGLYFVATPIGAARDVTLRALDILRDADVLAAEDTRTLRHLMDIHGVPLRGRPMIAYHDFNGAQARPRVLAALAEGLSVAYASEAGTPLVSDPGFQLGRAAIEQGSRVFAAPGPSAVLAALTVSGLPTDRFLFAGFAPTGGGARRTWLREFARVPATLVVYESPKRIRDLLTDMRLEFGAERRAAACRELTKRFEDVRRGTIDELIAHFEAEAPKGEFVLVVDRARDRAYAQEDIERALLERLGNMSVKDAAADVAGAMGAPRREIYQIALRLDRERR